MSNELPYTKQLLTVVKIVGSIVNSFEMKILCCLHVCVYACLRECLQEDILCILTLNVQKQSTLYRKRLFLRLEHNIPIQHK